MTPNWIDIVILPLLGAAVYGGLKIGLLRLLFLIAGFFGALFLGGWLFPHLLPIKDKTLLTVINGNLVLIFAIFAAFKGYDWGKRLRFSLSSGWRSAESVTGVVLSLAAVLLLTWLAAAHISTLPFAGLSNSVSDALIVQTLNRRMPAAPAVFNKFNQLVDPNTPPEIFVKKTAGASLGAALPPAVNPGAMQASDSVVRITSFGCGGISSGSGFVIAPELVATNAHVVAGSKRPIVKSGTRSFEAVPVLFNSNLDLAVLRVGELRTKPLSLSREPAGNGSKVSLLGFPGGNFAAGPGVIRNRFNLFGANIYDVGHVSREVYEIQGVVEDGNSGGPVVLPDSTVVGMLFAKSDLVDDYGYALTADDLSAALRQATDAHRRVSTRACFAG